ncbi:MAG TPA: hypothetical protein VGF75_03960 [Candidatus Saccharimonadales bacterium]|jgi:type II secretory pathway pseudopilin PulG
MYARPTTGAGFTIVETMIFLAISGLMFVFAISSMSGKQQQTEFQTSVDTLKSDLNLVLSDVSNGNFIDQVNGQYLQCSAANNKPSITASVTPPGIPSGSCTAIGEVVEFGSNTAGQQVFYTIPVFGCNYAQCNSTNPVSGDLTDAVPTINASYYQSTVLPFGLTINNSVINPPGAFGIFSFTSFETGGGGNGTLASGSQHVELFEIPDYTVYGVADNPNDLVGPINNNGLIDCTSPAGDVCTAANSDAEAIDPAAGLSLCVESGTSYDKSALFTLGGSNSATAVTDQLYTTKDCT